jgi:hypothetical protein
MMTGMMADSDLPMNPIVPNQNGNIAVASSTPTIVNSVDNNSPFGNTGTLPDAPVYCANNYFCQ